MDITYEQSSRNSEKDFLEKFSMFVDSGAGIIHVRTAEVLRAASTLRKQLLVEGALLHEWDVVSGFKKYELSEALNPAVPGDDNIDIASAYATPLVHVRESRDTETTHYYVYLNPHIFMENNPQLAHLSMLYASILPATNTVVVLLTPDIPLPEGNHSSILSINFDTPGLGELNATLGDIIESVSGSFSDGADICEEDRERICYVGAGLTKHAFETYAALSIVQAGREGKDTLDVEDVIKGVSIGKTDVVASSDILELYPSGSMSEVGGMENLKEWVSRRANCYSDSARDFGIEPPKGMVLLGPPGCGKSLAAKAISSELGVPLVRLDFGRVFNSLVGASEGRMRQALRQVEAMSPCCVGNTLVRLGGGEEYTAKELYDGARVDMLSDTINEEGETVPVILHGVIRRTLSPEIRLLSITDEYDNMITVTSNHKLLVRTDHGIVWKEAGNLKEGDELIRR